MSKTYHNSSILNKKISDFSALISVIGLGYVGLPLCSKILKLGFDVNGIDIDKKKVDLLNKKKVYIPSVSNKNFTRYINKKFFIHNNFACIKKSDIIIICVPTPLNSNNKPDLSPLKKTYDLIKPYLKFNQLIIIESSTYPGCTNQIFFEKLKKKFKIGENFFLGYSPEREDPGNKKFNISNITKVTSGTTKNCAFLTNNFYSKITTTKPVSSIEVAEFTKLYENVFRSVNIALANETKILANKLKIDINEVINAASTKPFGFTRFEPGPGVGGHCIPIDPFYLSWIAEKKNVKLNLTKSAAKINFSITDWIVKKIENYSKNFLKTKKPKIFIIGAAYKKNLNDLRMSPTLFIIKKLKKKFIIKYNDEYIKKIKTKMFREVYRSFPITKKNLQDSDLTLIMTDHDYLNKNIILKNSRIIFDTRNFFKTNNIKVKKL